MNSWLKADARNRMARAGLQALVAFVLIPTMDAALQVMQHIAVDTAAGRPFDWQRTGTVMLVSAVTGAVIAVLSYLHRLKLDPSSIPSALPPAPVEPLDPPTAVIPLSDPVKYAALDGPGQERGGT